MAASTPAVLPWHLSPCLTRWWGLAALGLLAGCATTGKWERTSYALEVRGAPVATVTLESPLVGNVVETHVEGEAATISIRYRGEATVQVVPGAKVEVEKVQLGDDSLPLVRDLLAGRYGNVTRALDSAGSTSSDDLSRELLLSLTDRAVAAVERTKEGRRLLDGLFSELTDGHLGTDDSRQAHRILAHRAQRIGLEAFTRAVLDPRTRIFPVRHTGVTVLHEASPELSWEDDGALHVKHPAHVYWWDDYPEARRLDFYGEKVGEDEIIGVRLYDQGGRVVFGPALMLAQHANQAQQQVLLKMAEMAALGLAAGLSGAAAKATFLVWCDRTAIALGVLTSIIDEHRGWILERYGEAGERFLLASDVVSSAVALYGLARVVTTAPQLVRSLRNSYSRFRAAEGGALKDVERATEELLHDLEGAEVISIEEARPPPAIEEPLQATGTDGTLIRLGDEAETTVASLRRGSGPNEPLRPVAPAGSRASRGGSGKVFRLAIPAQDAAEAEALAAKFAEAEAIAPGARQPANLGELEKLRPSVSRPPRGTDASNPRWQEYVAYWETRFEELAAGLTKKTQLEWPDYERLRNVYARGVEYERTIAAVLRADAAKPVGQRIFLRDVGEALVDSNVGVFKSNGLGTRYADHLVVDMSTVRSSKPRGVVFSCKSRTFTGLDKGDAKAIARADAAEAIAKYSGRVVVRRRGHVLFGKEIDVEKVSLVYEGELIKEQALRDVLFKEAAARGVEVLFR